MGLGSGIMVWFLLGAAGLNCLVSEAGLHEVVTDLLEDREGNLWVATYGGVGLLRRPRVLTFGEPEGLPEGVRTGLSGWQEPRG